MNLSLGSKSCPDLPFPHDNDLLIEKDVVDGMPCFHTWVDNLVFDKLMDWVGLEKILLNNPVL
jgi:hypothetical protein